MLCSLLTGCFESPPQIIALNPPRGSVGVQADTPVVVQFDRPVNPASLAGRVSVSPPIADCDLTSAFTAPVATGCRAVWITGHTAFVIQHPRAIFSPLTRYTFRVLGGFNSPDGVVNSVDHAWDLTTGSAPEVRNVSPGDGSRAVPIDSVITVAFSGGMAAAATAGAIRLDPPVPGTRVVRNSLDASRFVLFPGHVLASDSRYRVTVTRAATDQHHQPLLTAAQTTFTTGALSPGGHGVVLAKRIGELPSQVVVTSLAPTELGVPVPAAVMLEAPHCTASACGAAAGGAPLAVFSAAALSPGGRWLAVVEHDTTTGGAPPTLVVLDAARDASIKSIPGGDLPSWSPDGMTLAYAAGNDISLFEPATGAIRRLPPGDQLLAPAAWSPQGELLALEVGADAAHAHVELADSAVAARYPLPGLATAPASHPVISPDGLQLALERSGAGASGTWLVGVGSSAAAPRLLDPVLEPVGYAAAGTLLGLVRGPDGPTGLVRVNIDSDDRLSVLHPPQQSSLMTVVLSAGLRRFAFIATDVQGVDEAYVENADGTAAFAVTSFGRSGLYAAGVSLSG